MKKKQIMTNRNKTHSRSIVGYSKDFIKNLWQHSKAKISNNLVSGVKIFALKNPFLRQDLFSFYSYRPSFFKYHREEIKRILIGLFG